MKMDCRVKSQVMTLDELSAERELSGVEHI
jgi:hypothetical protein